MLNKKELLTGIHYLSFYIFIRYLKTWFELFWLDLYSKFKYYLIKFLNLVQDYFTQVCNIIS
jgi:hypothetical protein